MVLKFTSKGLAEAIHGEFGGTVHGAYWYTHLARDRKDIHDLAITTPGDHIKEQALSQGDM
jgi:hypothetical protein